MVAIKQAMQRLRGNGYPKRFVKQQLYRIQLPPNNKSRDWQATVSIPYKEGTSEAIRRILNKINVRVAFRKGTGLYSKIGASEG